MKLEAVNRNKIVINDLLYISALSIFYIYSMIATSTFIGLKKILLGDYLNPLILLLLASSMIYPKFKLRKKIAICLFFLLIAFILVQQGTNNKIPIVFSALFAVGLQNKDDKKVFRCLFLVNFTTLIILVAFSLSGYIDNLEFLRYDEGKETIRYALGMTHPNTFYIYFFGSVCMLLYINKYNNILIKIGIFLLSFFLYRVTDSRTGFMMIIGVLLLETCIERINFEKSKVLSNVIPLLFPLITLGCYLLTVFSNMSSPIFNFIDGLLSHRLLMMKKFYTIYGISVMGNSVTYKSIANGSVLNADLILDNTYIYLLIDMGLLFTIILCVLYYYLLKKLVSLNKKREIYLLIIYIFYAILERLTLLQYNFTILFFVYLLSYYSPRKFRIVFKK